MLWIWFPIVLAAILICVWIVLGIMRRKGGAGTRQPGETVYDRKD